MSNFFYLDWIWLNVIKSIANTSALFHEMFFIVIIYNDPFMPVNGFPYCRENGGFFRNLKVILRKVWILVKIKIIPIILMKKRSQFSTEVNLNEG